MTLNSDKERSASNTTTTSLSQQEASEVRLVKQSILMEKPIRLQLYIHIHTSSVYLQYNYVVSVEIVLYLLQ